MRNNDERRNDESASLADAKTNDLGPGLSRIEIPFGSLFIRIMWKTRELQNFRLFFPTNINIRQSHFILVSCSCSSKS